MILITKVLSFLYLKKIIKKIERKNNICINLFRYENGLTYPIYISKRKCKEYIDLLLINNKNKSHYVYIKDFNKFIFNNTKHKNKKHFCRYCLQGYSSERVLVDHKETYLEINGKQAVKLKRGKTKFRNYSK